MLKLVDKAKGPNVWDYWFRAKDWTLKDYWEHARKFCKVHKPEYIMVMEVHDAGDSQLAFKQFDKFEEFDKWAKEHTDVPMTQEGFELDYMLIPSKEATLELRAQDGGEVLGTLNVWEEDEKRADKIAKLLEGK